MSSFDNPANLDPRLRDDDPMMEFLTTATFRQPESGNLGHDDILDDDDVPASIQPRISAQGDNNIRNSHATFSGTSGVAAFGQIIKRIKKFEGKFESEFDNYCMVSLFGKAISFSLLRFHRRQTLKNALRCTLLWISRY
jgi:hypothetical protein